VRGRTVVRVRRRQAVRVEGCFALDLRCCGRGEGFERETRRKAEGVSTSVMFYTLAMDFRGKSANSPSLPLSPLLGEYHRNQPPTHHDNPIVSFVPLLPPIC